MSHLFKFTVTACLCVAWSAHGQTISGNITSLAGNGTQGFAGDGGPALSANLNLPLAAVLAGGNLYIADQVNDAIRVVNSSGVISTFAGSESTGYSGDNGKATLAQLDRPTGLAVDSSGNVYIADTANHCIREVKTNGIISTYAGTCQNAGYGGDGSGATGAYLNLPSGLAFDSAGNLYIADSGNNVIRKVTTSSGNISTFAGSYALGKQYVGDGKTANVAGMYDPVAIAFDSAGNLYIADSNNNVVRKVATNLIITTVAGNGTTGFKGDGGTPQFAELSHPRGVAVDASGNVYISDSLNNRIRVVSPNGATINTVIGSGAGAYYGDNGPALQAGVSGPSGLSFDSSGNLIISDTNNCAIRKFTPVSSGGAKPAISSGGVITASQFGGYSAVAPGTWIEIYGTNLANTTTTWSNSFQGNSAPTTVGGTSVTVAGLNAYIDYVSPTQVNAQVPTAINTGSQQVVVSTGAGQSAAFSITVVNTEPGLLAPSQFSVGGKQYVAAYHQDGTVVMPTGAVSGVTSSPAKAGETITLYGVGFGAVNTGQQAGQIVQSQNSLTTPLSMFFGSAQATLNYEGLTPGYVGLYQFNVVVPTVASGSAIPLTYILGNTNSTQTLYTAVQ